MENTCIAFQHTDLKNAYRAILNQMLRSHGVKSLNCCSDTERFFDRIEVNADGTLTVTKCGNLTFDNLYFDYTCDFARCISYIEDAIYQQRHGVNMEHCIVVKFA